MSDIYQSQTICNKCGRPFVYVGDIPEGGFIKGQEPYCTCHQNCIVSDYIYNSWKFCPHCGKELK